MEWIKTADKLPKPFEPVLLVHHKHKGKDYDVDAGIYIGTASGERTAAILSASSIRCRTRSYPRR